MTSVSCNKLSSLPCVDLSEVCVLARFDSLASRDVSNAGFYGHGPILVWCFSWLTTCQVLLVRARDQLCLSLHVIISSQLYYRRHGVHDLSANALYSSQHERL